MNKQDIKEKIIFVSIMFGIFLPVRILFYTFVSEWWVGSFGVISGIMILLLYLVKKGKLGYFGRIWKKQIIKISQGKLGIIIMMHSIIIIMFTSGIVYITDMNIDTEETDEMLTMFEKDNVTSVTDMFTSEKLEMFYDMSLDEYIEVVKFISENPQMIGVMYAVMDDFTLGLHQHLNIIFLVEEIEAFVFVIYFRYFYKMNK